MEEVEEKTFDVLQATEFDSSKIHTRRTRPHMTEFERARIIGMRGEQIANGTPPFVEKIEGDNPMDTAEREFAAGRIPFIIRRFVPANGKVTTEDWKIQELEPVDRRLQHRAPTILEE